jgi:hypothetical protein
MSTSTYLSPSFTRDRQRTAGPCDACENEATNPKGLNPQDLMLVLDFRESVVTLCPKHEAWLLTKLLANYIKRRSKGKVSEYMLKITETVEATKEVNA